MVDNQLVENGDCVDLEFSFWIECKQSRRKRQSEMTDPIPCKVDDETHDYSDIEAV